MRHNPRVLLTGLSILLLALSSCIAQRVKTGAEVLVEQRLGLLRGKRVGIICNQTSVFPDGTHLVDSLLKLGVHVTALFGPEHGVRGTSSAGESVADSADARTGLPLYSLYGKAFKPTSAMLQNVDVLLFDMQDAGARYYTYVFTMAKSMEAAEEFRKQFILLDRPNPINGESIEGPLLDTAFRSSVGMFPVPVRHGMTLGEIAKMIVGEKWLGKYSDVDLSVIPMEGWKRSMWYDETGLPWVAPSPNMKTLTTATVYPGTCLFEQTNVTEGRGTAKPFEILGAPWIDPKALTGKLNGKNLPGLQFEPVTFTPSSDPVAAPNPKFNHRQCGGVFVHVTDRNVFEPLHSALTMINAIHEMYPDSLLFGSGFDRLAGDSTTRKELLRGTSAEEILARARGEIPSFRSLRLKYLLYK
jgi:uncharacterized protein YbbC (DUF1343 family)